MSLTLITVILATMGSAAPVLAAQSSVTRWWGSLTGVAFPDTTHGFAVSQQPAAALTTVDGGRTWLAQGFPAPDPTLLGVSATDASHAVAVGYFFPTTPAQGVAFNTTNGGASWNRVAVPVATVLRGVQMIDSLHGVAVGYATSQGSFVRQGVIVTTSDGGSTWTHRSVPTDVADLFAVQFANAPSGVVVGIGSRGGVALTTADSGLTWSEHPIDPSFNPASVWLTNPAHGVVVGDVLHNNAAIFTTADGGTTWTAVTVPASSYRLNAVAFAPHSTHGWAAGNPAAGSSGTTLLTTTDGGATWQPVQVPAYTPALLAISAPNSTAAWAVGFASCTGNPIIATSDGSTWHAQLATTPYLSRPHGVALGGSRQGWVVGFETCSGGGVRATADGGRTWTRQPLPQGVPVLEAVHSIDSNHAWAVGGEKGSISATGAVVATVNGGGTWSRQTLPSDVADLVAVSAVDTHNAWAVGSATNGPPPFFSATPVIVATNDGGVVWRDQTVPSNISQLRGVSFVSPQHGWAIGLDNSSNQDDVITTIDGGADWLTTPDQLPGVFLSGIAFADDLNGVVVGSQNISGGLGQSTQSGAALVTHNGGASWSPGVIPGDVTELDAVTMASATTGYAIRVNGRPTVVNTVDGGTTWHEQVLPTGVLEVDAVATASPTVAWIAAVLTQGPGVVVTTDGGANWTALLIAQ